MLQRTPDPRVHMHRLSDRKITDEHLSPEEGLARDRENKKREYSVAICCLVKKDSAGDGFRCGV
jgi:hypothetical protein